MGGIQSTQKAKRSKNQQTTPCRLIPFLDVEVFQNVNDTCSLSGITCLTNGRIVVADYLGFNVKFYDWKRLQLLDAFQLYTQPYEVCKSAVEETEFFVSTPFEERILHFTSKGDSITLLRYIPTEGRCYGVASFNKGLAVGLRVDKRNWQVEILDYNGRVMNVFKEDKDGADLFGYADYLTVDANGRRLYVSDGVQNAVLCLDLHGASMTSIREIYRFVDPHLSVPKGLTLDDAGNVFVVGCETSNVHVISPPGTSLGLVLGRRELLDNPMAIAFDVNERKMLVTEGSRKVMIFMESVCKHS